MIEKEFKTTVILNWKNGKFRALKNVNMKKLSAMEIPISLNVKVKIPERQMIVVKAEIELDSEKAGEIALDYLKGDDIKDEQGSI